MHVLENMAKLIGTDLVITSRLGALVAKFGNYEALIQNLAHSRHERSWPYSTDQLENDKSGLLLLLRSTDGAYQDFLWVVFHQLASKLEEELENLNGDCWLICPREVTGKDRHHGYFFPSSANFDSYEKIQSSTKLRKKIPKCRNCPNDSIDLQACFPSEAAIIIMKCLSEADDSPFDLPTPPEENFLDIGNILAVVSTENIPNLAEKVKNHPACLSNKEKFFIIRAVRQYFDHLEVCKHKNCRCYLSDKAYVVNFAFFEKNSAIVTNGNWKIPMQSFVDKYGFEHKVTGNGSSSTAFVRAYRNDLAHFDPSGKHLLSFMNDMDQAFRWAIMHFFTFQQLKIPDQNPSLKEFAKSFEIF